MSGNQKQGSKVPSNLEPAQLAPHSQEAEEAVLGSILINPNAFDTVSGYLKSSHFFLLHYRWIYEAMERIAATGEIVEYLTVIEELRHQGRLDDVGGIARITYLSTNVGSSLNADAYANLVFKAARRRALMESIERQRQAAYDEALDLAEVERKVQNEMAGWLDGNSAGMKREKARPLSDLALEDADRLQETFEKGNRGVSTGIPTLDFKVRYHPKKLYIFAMDTGGGKSIFAMNAMKAAMENGQRVLYCSLEMGWDEQVSRLVAMKTGVSAELQDQGGMTEDDFKKAYQMRLSLSQNPNADKILIDERAGLKLAEIDQAIKDAIKELGGLDLVIVDHMQLLTSGGATDNEIAQRMKVIADKLKEYAKNHKVPVLALAQFRNFKGKAAEIPTMDMIYGGAAVKQAANTILIGHRPDMYEDFAELVPAGVVNRTVIRCDKNRGGPSNWTEFIRFVPERTMFVSYQKEPVNMPAPSASAAD